MRMYGLVNQAMQDLVVAKFGQRTWTEILARADVHIDPFLTMSAYPDELTYRMVAAAAEILHTPVDDILRTFGEFWIDYSARHGYGELLDLLGSDLPSFLLALDGMHDRLRLTFPELNPPSIWCTEVTPGSLFVHYASDRDGLAPFLVGLLTATARRFGEEAEIRQVRSRADGHEHDEFFVLRRPAVPAQGTAPAQESAPTAVAAVTAVTTAAPEG